MELLLVLLSALRQRLPWPRPLAGCRSPGPVGCGRREGDDGERRDEAAASRLRKSHLLVYWECPTVYSRSLSRQFIYLYLRAGKAGRGIRVVRLWLGGGCAEAVTLQVPVGGRQGSRGFGTALARGQRALPGLAGSSSPSPHARRFQRCGSCMPVYAVLYVLAGTRVPQRLGVPGGLQSGEGDSSSPHAGQQPPTPGSSPHAGQQPPCRAVGAGEAEELGAGGLGCSTAEPHGVLTGARGSLISLVRLASRT